MADPITLDVAQARLQEYLDAEQAVLLGGQEVRLTAPNGVDRMVIQADLRQIRRGIGYWQNKIAALQAQAGGAPTIGGITFASANFGNCD